MFNFGAWNIGYRDQNYNAEYTDGKAKYSGYFDSTPLNYSYMASSPWVESQTGVFTLHAAARLQVQNKVAGVVGVPSSARWNTACRRPAAAASASTG